MQLENKIALLSQELERVKGMMEGKNKELEEKNKLIQ